jgi:hypothetical protein
LLAALRESAAGAVCAESGIFLILWIGLLFVGRSLLFQDPGTFWHVAVGEHMLDNARLIQTDPFSFTRGGEPWTAHQWLSECLMAVLHRFGGWDALLLATATLLAGLYTWIAGRLLRSGLKLLPTVVVLAAVLAASTPNFHIRPLVFTLAGMAWTYGLLLDVQSRRCRLRALAWLIPAFALWANLHAGVLAGIGSLALVTVGWATAWLAGRPSPITSRRDLAVLGAITAAAALSVLVNPYGIGLPRAWFRTMALPLTGLIQEHAPLVWGSAAGAAVLGLAIAYAIVLGGTWGRWPGAAWLLPAVWLVLGAQRIRNAPVFAMVGALGIADLLPHSRAGDVLRRRGWMSSAPPGGDDAATRPRRWTTLMWLALLGGVIVQASGVEAPLVGRGWARLDSGRWPVELIPEIRRLDAISPEGTRIFNDLDFGGLLIYYAPRLAHFVDDRCALYGREILSRYDRMRTENPAEIRALQAEYGFRYALVETGGRLDGYLAAQPAWQILGHSPRARLYEFAAPGSGGRRPRAATANAAWPSGARGESQ